MHEAYLRLVDRGDETQWDNRRHFFAAAAEAMRRILLNRARDKNRLKRSGGRQRIDLEHLTLAGDILSDEILAVDEALEKLSGEDAVAAELVKLRFFAGMSLAEAAKVLSLARRTADRCWAFARAWLYNELSHEDESAR